MLALLVLSFSFYLSVFAGPVSQRAPWQPILYGCQNSIISSDNPYRLTSSTTYSQYWECKYTFQEFDGTTSVAYCWYDYQNHTIYRWPNTPLPGTYSDENCPTVVGKASKYLIKTSSTGKCVTKMGDYDGAPVQIQDCDYRHGNPSQVWFFDGSTIKQGNKCLDVKDGVTANGARLQTWTCVDGAANQQFYHWVRNFLVIPEDHISWMAHQGQCMDLTDGKLTNGTPIQMWGCYYPNPNQKWYLEPMI